MIRTGYKRYGIDFNRLVGQLVPLWLRGQKLVLFLQACVYPLQSLSDRFRIWAEKTRIDVSMTSQVIMLEWYFDRMFGKGKVRIYNYFSNTNPCYYRNSLTYDRFHLPCFYRNESVTETSRKPLYRTIEEDSYGTSFVVEVAFSLRSHEPEIRRIIEKYKIVNKTYKINYI